MAPNEKTPESILHAVFGYSEFRPLQRDVIESVLARRDTLAIMPTGGGKSLCYQIPALLFDGLTVVISPLISLMHDQVAQLQALGVAAAALNSSLEWEEYRLIMDKVRQRKIKLLYVAPETLLTDRVMGLLNSVKVDCITIDEAHCISEWGHDFRPEYRQLAALRQRFPQAACLALTATATERVRQDIQNALGFKQGQPFLASFNRPNLFLEVQPKKDPLAQTIGLLRKYPDQSGIIYCFSRQQVDDLAGELARRGFSARPYHAGLSDAERKANQDAFVRDDAQIIVATIAFGMGINKPNVRFVVHYDLPKNIESYYQEIGRAGRDGLPSHCLLLYSYADTRKIEFFIKQKQEPERSNASQHLKAMTRYAESSGCRRRPLLGYFGENYSQKDCDSCDYCARERATAVGAAAARADLTQEAHLFFDAARRTGERFGAGYLIDFLLGRTSEKILKFSHERLPGFGGGRQLSESQWFALSRQLQDQGLLERTEYNGLRLSAQGELTLATRKPVLGAPLPGAAAVGRNAGFGTEMETEPPAALAPPQRRPAQTPGEGKKRDLPLLQYDVVLFDRLRALRKSIADQEKIAPYMVLPDRSLVEMSAYTPLSSQSLAQIHGFGEVKLAKYGPRFLQTIQDYSRARASGK